MTGHTNQQSGDAEATTSALPSEQPEQSGENSNAVASSSSAPSTRKVRVVGAPPPGPPVPKDDTHSDDEGDDDREDAKSIGSVEEEGKQVNGGAEGEDEKVDLLANFEEGDESLHLTHLSLKNSHLRKLNLPRFASHLKSICLRQNLISRFTDQDIGALEELEDLDLYDNGLEKTYGEILKGCGKLTSLDFSFNSIRHISSLAHLSHLKTLYFVQNKISRVREEDFDGPIAQSLTSLELGGNKLRGIENLERLTKLEELWLGKNKIPKLENLEAFTNLRILSIQSNRITKLENLDGLTSLEELYISHNGLTEISGLSTLKKLRVLDIGGNQITSIQGLEGLDQLEEFWANNNRIESLNELEEQLGPKACPNLETIYLEGNPVQGKEGSSYRRKIMLLCPQVKQIDATFVRATALR